MGSSGDDRQATMQQHEHEGATERWKERRAAIDGACQHGRENETERGVGNAVFCERNRRSPQRTITRVAMKTITPRKLI